MKLSPDLQSAIDQRERLQKRISEALKRTEPLASIQELATEQNELGRNLSPVLRKELGKLVDRSLREIRKLKQQLKPHEQLLEQLQALCDHKDSDADTCYTCGKDVYDPFE